MRGGFEILRQVNRSVSFGPVGSKASFGPSRFRGPGFVGASVALSARLEIRQGQGLVITPQLQQAIKRLQLSNLELEAFVEAELERNTLLACDDVELDTADAESHAETADVALDRMDEAAARADVDAAHDAASP